MKRFKILALIAALAAAACGDDDDASPPEQTSLLRVIHDSPDAPDVDVLFDDAIALEDVPYLGASDYLTVPAGPANLKVAVAGTDMVVIDADVDLAADVAYSVVAVNLVADIDAVVLVDNLTPPAADETRVRLIHGAPSAPTVDIYVTGPDDPLGAPTLSGVPYLAVADDLTVPSGTYRVRITPEGTQDVAIDTGAVMLESGVAYTAIAVDADGGGAPFGALLLVDEAGTE
jgi:hypothetical protein